MPAPNEEQTVFWEELAPAWLASADHTEMVSASFGEAAMDRLRLRAGQRVLDIGCGSGSTTLALGELVGPEGEAVGIDIASTMVTAATEHATSAGITNATFVVADAQVADLGDSTYDAAYSRFGVMFFADPKAAFTNIHTALKPHGAFAFACWSNLFANEWMFVPGAAVVSVTGSLPPMPGPGEPGPFSLDDPDRVELLLREAGFTEIDVTPLPKTIVIPRAKIDSLVSLTRRVGAVREALRTVDDATGARIVAAVREALVERVEHDEVRLSAAAFIVSAYA